MMTQQFTLSLGKVWFETKNLCLRKMKYLLQTVGNESLGFCFYFAAFLLLVQIYETDAACTNRHYCRNEYDPNNKVFTRNYWGLTEVPTDIPTEAQRLYLENNAITSLPPGLLGHLDQCIWLSFLYNHISRIELGTFDFLGDLEELDLCRNRIIRIDRVWRGLDNLKVLKLGYNPISFIELGAFDSLNNLEELHFDAGNISSIERGSLRGLGNLKTIFFCWNQISQIGQGAFDSLNSLEVLHLSSNKLHSIGPVWRGLNSLKVLYLFSNGMTLVEEGTFDSLTVLETLHLGGNQISNISGL